jgi:hypothetical protein
LQQVTVEVKAASPSQCLAPVEIVLDEGCDMAVAAVFAEHRAKLPEPLVGIVRTWQCLVRGGQSAPGAVKAVDDSLERRENRLESRHRVFR